MRKTAHLLTGLLAALILTACGGNNGQPIAERDTVSVSGEGTIKARPDIFNLVAVARERGDDVAAMKDEVDRQVQAIEAAQTDVSSVFQGPNSCINGDLRNMIDFSNAIPDLAGLIGNLQTVAVDQLLQQGLQKACDVVNEQIAGVVGDLNISNANWQSALPTEVSQIISDGQIVIPN